VPTASWRRPQPNANVAATGELDHSRSVPCNPAAPCCVYACASSHPAEGGKAASAASIRICTACSNACRLRSANRSRTFSSLPVMICPGAASLTAAATAQQCLHALTHGLDVRFARELRRRFHERLLCMGLNLHQSPSHAPSALISCPSFAQCARKICHTRQKRCRRQAVRL